VTLPTTQAELDALLDAVEARVRRHALADGMDLQRKAFAAAFALFEPLARKAFDPNEPRGADGKWGSGGNGKNGKNSDPPHPDAPAHSAHAAEGLAAKLPAGVWDRVGDKVLTAAAKVYGVMLRATPAAMKAMALFEAVGDTPADLAKLGYAPGAGATASAADAARLDPMRHATGGLVSTHVAATIASHVLGRAYVYAKSKLRPEVRKAFGLDGWAVTKGYDPSEKRDDGGKWTAGGGPTIGSGERSRRVVDVPDPEGEDAADVKVLTNPTPDEIRSKLDNLRPSQPIRAVLDGDTLHVWWEQDVHHQPTAKVLGIKRLVGFEDRLFITRDRDTARVMVETHAPNERVKEWAFHHGFGYGGEYPDEPDEDEDPADVVEKAYVASATNTPPAPRTAASTFGPRSPSSIASLAAFTASRSAGWHQTPPAPAAVPSPHSPTITSPAAFASRKFFGPLISPPLVRVSESPLGRCSHPPPRRLPPPPAQWGHGRTHLQ
jgi:hypothetical protein